MWLHQGVSGSSTPFTVSRVWIQTYTAEIGLYAYTKDSRLETLIRIHADRDSLKPEEVWANTNLEIGDQLLSEPVMVWSNRGRDVRITIQTLMGETRLECQKVSGIEYCHSEVWKANGKT